MYWWQKLFIFLLCECQFLDNIKRKKGKTVCYLPNAQKLHFLERQIRQDLHHGQILMWTFKMKRVLQLWLMQMTMVLLHRTEMAKLHWILVRSGWWRHVYWALLQVYIPRTNVSELILVWGKWVFLLNIYGNWQIWKVNVIHVNTL